MMNILHDLYYGHISGWERRIVRTAKENAINEKIKAERRYFTEKMSDEDKKRFDKLENMYTQSHATDDLRIFTHGFRLAAMLMCAVFMGEKPED